MQIVLVLGNHSQETMIKRLNEALSYYQKIVEKIKEENIYFMVSGCGKNKEYEFMREYVSTKIPQNKIIVEDKSNSTYENLIFSIDIINRIFGEKNEVIKLIISSSSFHIKRVIIMSKLLFSEKNNLKLTFVHTHEIISFEEELREANNIQEFIHFYSNRLLEDKLKY